MQEPRQTSTSASSYPQGIGIKYAHAIVLVCATLPCALLVQVVIVKA
jgi:hypothetical protein